MTKRFYLLCCVLALAAINWSVAQESAPVVRRANPPDQNTQAPATLDGNYALTLSVGEKGKASAEMYLALAAPDFAVSLTQPPLAFQGALTKKEDGSFLVRYNLGGGAAVSDAGFRQASTQATVLLRVGEPLVIFKDLNGQTFQLRLDRLGDKAAKAP